MNLKIIKYLKKKKLVNHNKKNKFLKIKKLLKIQILLSNLKKLFKQLNKIKIKLIQH